MTVKLGYTPTLASGTDISTRQFEGDYFLDGTYVNAHTTENIAGMLNVKRFNFTGQRCVQTITTYSNPPRTFRRIVDIAYGGVTFGSPTGLGVWSEILVGGQGFSGDILFDKTATRNIGSSNNTVNNLYMQNAVTVVSDETKKSEIQDIPDAVLDVWATIDFQMYKLNDAIAEKSEKARFHFGVIAQRIKEAFDKAGIDYNQYGLLTYSKWDAIQAVKYVPATYDDNFNQITPEVKAIEGREAGEVYMVRYDECMILEMAYQRKKIASITQENTQLSERLNSLESENTQIKSEFTDIQTKLSDMQTKIDDLIKKSSDQESKDSNN